MFEFGRPEDTAELLWKNAVTLAGPGLPDCHWDEMEEEDLSNALAYLYLAVREAILDEVSKDVIGVLVSQYDEVFEAVASNSEEFRNAVKTGKHRIVLGPGRENREKYEKLAGLTPSES
jgi:hypothetical protein